MNSWPLRQPRKQSVFLDPLHRFANRSGRAPMQQPLRHHRLLQLRQPQPPKGSQCPNLSLAGNSKGCHDRVCHSRDGRRSLNSPWAGPNSPPCNPAGLNHKVPSSNPPFVQACIVAAAVSVLTLTGGFAPCAGSKTWVTDGQATCSPWSMISVSSSQMLGEARTPEMLMPTLA